MPKKKNKIKNNCLEVEVIEIENAKVVFEKGIFEI